MRFTSIPLILITSLLTAAPALRSAELETANPKPNPPRIAPASDEAELAIRRFKAEPGFRIELFAAEPMLAHPVAFAIDERNRFYVAESFRVGGQVTDIRGHMAWLDEELASTSTAAWRKIVEKYLGDRREYMTAEGERLQLLEDTDGDGRADRSTTFAEGFNDIQSGIAAGVLARRGDVWFTCIPDLWRFRDQDGDGKADDRQVLQHGYGVRFGFYGHDLHGLRLGPDGRLYFSIGDRGFNVLTKEGKRVAAPESGAVLRCNPDGSELEIFATGLRNPQELAFDDYGNLFTGDNNSDGGDQARWVHLVEGGDSGWRIGWQFLTWPMPRGPWNAEKMWHPQNEDQPAFIVPPLANFGNGPSGLTYYPGIGLPREFDRHFFMADFKGTPGLSLVHSFALAPRGASFEVTDRKPFLSFVLATDVEFGFDGAIYVSDWVQGWGKTGKGRIYRVFHEEERKNPLVAATADLMSLGFTHRNVDELLTLLSHPDQRVRQESQFELAERGAGSVRTLSTLALSGTHQLARIHAIWALSQIARSTHSPNPVRPLLPLLKDSDAEVRAQTAKVLGEARVAAARRALSDLAVDSRSPRVQFFAIVALGKLRDSRGGSAIVSMLAQNADRDPFLRHAGVMALHGLNDDRLIARAGGHSSAAVRMAALLAMRRSGNPRIAGFLGDREPKIVIEAARAIYDLNISSAMPKLAALSGTFTDSEPLLRRVVNARYRVGTRESAVALAQLAADSGRPLAGRVEALVALNEWAKPPGRDRVTGLWRPLPERNPVVAAEALSPVLAAILNAGPGEVQIEGARAAAIYGIQSASGSLRTIAASEAGGSKARIEALRALLALKSSELNSLLDQVERSADEDVRKEASSLLAKLNPTAGAGRLAARLREGSLGEKQAALLGLGMIRDSAADQVLGEWMEKLLAGQVEPTLRLELIEAARKRAAPGLDTQLAKFESARSQDEAGKFAEALHGGNAEAGRKIFFERTEVSCARCHKVGGQGGEAGPELDKPGGNRTREYLVESIVAPAKQIAPGFENVIVRFKGGGAATGTVKSETETELVIISPEDGLIKIAKAEIESREAGGTGMPEGLAGLLSVRELRDLIEYLATR